MMSTSNNGDWSIEQQLWLDDHYAAYEFLHSNNDLSAFWTYIFDNFLSIWPVRNTLWPTLPRSHAFSPDELRSISKAEARSKLVRISRLIFLLLIYYGYSAFNHSLKTDTGPHVEMCIKLTSEIGRLSN